MKKLPPGGLAMWMAMRTIFDPQMLSLLEQYDQAVASGQGQTSLAATVKLFWSHLARLAVDGLIEVTGYAPGEVQERPIGVGLLLTATPDLDRHRLHTDAGVFVGVMIRCAMQTTASRPGIIEPAPPSTGGQAAVEWMRTNVTEPRRWKRADAIKKCANDTGATHREAQSAWNQLAPSIRGSRGAHK